jgi:tRNA G18 (ribose-2'-O)-methylase SpoU
MSFESVQDFIGSVRKPGRPPFVVVETAVGSQSLYDFQLPPEVGEFHLIIGGERKGVDTAIMASLIDDYDHTVFIPMHGRLKSMNVSHALAVVLNELGKQRHLREGDRMRHC